MGNLSSKVSSVFGSASCRAEPEKPQCEVTAENPLPENCVQCNEPIESSDSSEYEPRFEPNAALVEAERLEAEMNENAIKMATDASRYETECGANAGLTDEQLLEIALRDSLEEANLAVGVDAAITTPKYEEPRVYRQIHSSTQTIFTPRDTVFQPRDVIWGEAMLGADQPTTPITTQRQNHQNHHPTVIVPTELSSIGSHIGM